MSMFLTQYETKVKVFDKYILSALIVTCLSACGSTSEGKLALPVLVNKQTPSVEKVTSPDITVNKPIESNGKTKSKSTNKENVRVDVKKNNEKGSISKTNKIVEKVAVMKRAGSAKKSLIVSSEIEKPSNSHQVTRLPSANTSALDVVLLTSLDILPLMMKDGWQLIYAASPMNKNIRCLLVNEVRELHDGYKVTNLRFWLEKNKLELQSASNFDLSYPDVGVYFLTKEGLETYFSIIPSHKPTSLIANINKELNLTTVEELVVKIGFWPTWPVTKTTVITLLFSQREKMLALQEKCNALHAELK